MDDTLRDSKLEQCLRGQENALLEMWEKAILPQKKFRLSQTKDWLHEMLGELLAEVRGRLADLQPSPLQNKFRGFSESGPRGVLAEIHLLRLGERVLADNIRKRLDVSDGDWREIRRRINRVFHELILWRTSPSCATCSTLLHGKMDAASRHEEALRSAYHRPCGR